MGIGTYAGRENPVFLNDYSQIFFNNSCCYERGVLVKRQEIQ
jgi:hypothetical protein